MFWTLAQTRWSFVGFGCFRDFAYLPIFTLHVTQAYNVEKELPPTSLQLSTLIESPWFRWSNIPKQTLVHHGALYICPLEQKLRGRRKTSVWWLGTKPKTNRRKKRTMTWFVLVHHGVWPEVLRFPLQIERYIKHNFDTWTMGRGIQPRWPWLKLVHSSEVDKESLQKQTK